MPRTRRLPRGKRPPGRAASANAAAINNAIPGPSGINRPSGGVGIKNIENRRGCNKNIKIKKLIAQRRNIGTKKNGVVVQKMVVRRTAIYQRKCPKQY